MFAFVQNPTQLCCPHHLPQCPADTDQGPLPLALSVFHSLPENSLCAIQVIFDLSSSSADRVDLAACLHPLAEGHSVSLSAAVLLHMQGSISASLCTEMCSSVDRWENNCRRRLDGMKSQAV